MARESGLEDIIAWLESQILATQCDWMDHTISGNDEMRRQQEAILDGIYLFRNEFFDVPIPPVGQGYEPPEATWDAVIRERKLTEIDAKITALTAEREAITGPQGDKIRGRATLGGTSDLTADAEVGAG